VSEQAAVQQVRQPAKPAAPTRTRGVLQRACACGKHAGNGGECAECRKKRLGLQRRAVGQGPDVAPPIVHEVLRSPGRPLDDATRGFMESRFNHDFSHVPATAPRLATAGLVVGPADDPLEREAERQSQRVMRSPATNNALLVGPDFSRVRIHTGAAAAKSALAVNARAYTVGQNVVFGVGEYAPGTSAGRSLLAHELMHVVQQNICPGMTLQRDDKGRGDTQKSTEEQITAEEKEANALVSELEGSWKELRDSAAGFAELKTWIAKGDVVIALIREHTQAGFQASKQNEQDRYQANKFALETDLVAYNYIAWSTLVFGNLLAVRSDTKRLSRSFAADNRAFTGRAEAEQRLKEIEMLVDKLLPESAETIKLVSISRQFASRPGSNVGFAITTTSAIDEKIRSAMVQKTSKLITTQIGLQTSVTFINEFLDVAFFEGVEQTKDAIQQFSEVRNILRRGAPKSKKVSKGDRKKGKDRKSKKCTNEEVERRNREIHNYCDQPRSCSMQLDNCQTATAKVAAGNGCVRLRTELQHKCFSPGDPGYMNHMARIAQDSAALQNCIAVMSAKCKP